MKPELTKLKAWVDAKKWSDKLYGEPPVRSSDLLACCPWCGGEASATGVIRYSKSHEAWWQDGTQIREAYFVNCIKCGVTNQGLCGHQTPQAAITHWNTRNQANDQAEPLPPDGERGRH